MISHCISLLYEMDFDSFKRLKVTMRRKQDCPQVQSAAACTYIYICKDKVQIAIMNDHSYSESNCHLIFALT